MRLEDEIQQKKFKTEQQKAVINLFYTTGFLMNQFNEKAKAFDITRQQYNVLRILRGQHPKSASINLIKDRMLDKMSDASRIVERLRLKGLIERKASTSDKRVVDISITEKGLRLLEEMSPHIDTIDNVFKTFTSDEVARLNELLDRIRG